MSLLSLPLYFNHVPKCAGTSLNELLSRSLHRSTLGVEPFVPALNLYNLDATRLDGLMLVGSHFPHWAAARRLPGWSTLTVVRKPWPRFLSLTRHLLRIQGSEPQALLPGQVHYLALVRERRYKEALQQATGWYPFDASMAQCFLDAPPDGDVDRLGRTAVAVVEGYDGVLLSERLDHDWPALETIFNGGSVGDSPRLNTSGEYGDASVGPFPPDLEPLFHALFPFERAVYAAAERVYAQTTTSLAEDARNLARIGPGRAARASTTVDWDGPVRCGGFSDRMLAASFGFAGRYARRVEAQVGVLDLDVRATSRARLEGVFWISSVTGRFGCKVSVNGVPVPLFDERLEVGCPTDPSQLWAAADIPPTALGSGHLRIAFDRRNAPEVVEFWVLDLAVRSLAG
jgi:hypothetical protein